MTRKDTIFLHVGMHKTASTTIQAGLKDFTDGTTRYARLGPANHSVPMLTAFAADPAAHPYYTKRGLGPGEVAARRAKIRAILMDEIRSSERNLVISGEEMTVLGAADLRDMRDTLAPQARRLHILAYLREPVGYASSAFQQVSRQRKARAIRIPRPNYRRRFEPFTEVFGREAMEFVAFHPPAFPGQCVVTDFCTRVGIDPGPVPKLTRNESLSAEAVALLVAWARDGHEDITSPARVRARDRLIASLRKGFPGRFRFATDLVAEHLDPADRDWIEKTAGFPLPPAPKGEGGIRGLGDLTALAEDARHRLRQLLDDAGAGPSGETPANMMDTLFSAFLEQARRN